MAGRPAAGSDAQERDEQRGASPTLDDTRVELAFVENCERALKRLSDLSDGTVSRDAAAIQALLEGTGFGAAGVARFSEDRSEVVITFQNMHQMLLEETRLAMADLTSARAILEDHAVSIAADACTVETGDALIVALAAQSFHAEPISDGSLRPAGFLFAADDKPAPAALATVRTLFAGVAAWLGADGADGRGVTAEPATCEEDPGTPTDSDEMATPDCSEGSQRPDAPGVMVYGADHKLLVAAGQVTLLADAPGALMQAGAALDELIGHLGTAPGDDGATADDRAARMRDAVAAGTGHSLRLNTADGRFIDCDLSPTDGGGYAVMFSDATDAERDKRAAAEQARALEATVQHMDQGLFAVDKDLKLIFASDRARTTLGVPEQYFDRGGAFEAIIRHAADQGAFGDDEGAAVADAILKDARGSEPFTYEQICPGDWATLVHAHPRPEGGFVFTFSDIAEAKQRQTELRQLSETLQQRTEELRQKSFQLDKLFNNMSSGVAMFDAEQRLVIANPRYQEFFNLPDELVQAGTSLTDMFHYCIEQGYEGDADTVLEERLEVARSRERQTFNMNMSDGRIMHAIHEPVEDGGSIAVYEDITEREQAAQQLREYADRIEVQKNTLQTVMEHMDQGISLVDADLKLRAFNPRFLELLEFPAEEFKVGDELASFLRYNAKRGEYGPGDVETQVNERVDLAKKFEAHSFVRERPDGTQIEIVGKPLSGQSGFVTTYTDVTEARLQQREVEALTQSLTEVNHRLDAAFNSMHQGLAMFDADHKLMVRNKRYMEIFDFPEDVASIGEGLEDIARFTVERGNEPDAEQAIAKRMEIAASRERTVYHRNMSDGRVLEIIHEPLAGGGSVALYLDVTDRIHSQRRLQEHAAQLEASNRELQDFAYVASHDLQEPLRKIEAFGDRLHKKCGDRLGEDGRLYVNRMQDSSRRLRALINALLDYSRVTTKAKPFESVHLNKVAAHVLTDLETTIERAGATVDVGDLPCIDADEVQMRQLFLNLLTNALKFKKEDVPLAIRIDAKLVGAADQTGGTFQTCVLTVTDNGVGFENKYADRIFTIFQRLHSRSEYEGTGIGLATCRKIAERHHGTIAARGELGEGAVFTVCLPVVQAQPLSLGEEDLDI